ncbi:hypothetical protein QJS10_CPB17g00408 [Acorus calamus]|uniref:Uncharacterized protein n=1 Tax=Acorus calamus TaxID=4465 RepID=A0AAV9CVA4_ACOCL|nr:hypothetical protein QJS10_CPB17g00408 [Acorus calamus]
MIGQPTNQNPQRGTLTTTRSGGHALWPTGTIFLGLGGEEGTAQIGSEIRRPRVGHGRFRPYTELGDAGPPIDLLRRRHRSTEAGPPPPPPPPPPRPREPAFEVPALRLPEHQVLLLQQLQPLPAPPLLQVLPPLLDQGGVLRNVPVGGGSRKSSSKRNPSPKSASSKPPPPPPPTDDDDRHRRSSVSSSDSSTLTAADQSLPAAPPPPPALTILPDTTTGGGGFRGLMMSATNQGFGFSDVPPFRFQEEMKMPELLHGGYIDQTVQIDLPPPLGPEIAGLTSGMDWPATVESEVYDLHGAVDQVYFDPSYLP